VAHFSLDRLGDRLDRHHPVEEETLPRLSVEVEDGDQVALILPRVRPLDRAGREQVRRARAAHRPVRAVLLRERHERGTGGEDGEGGGGVEGHGRLRCCPLRWEIYRASPLKIQRNYFRAMRFFLLTQSRRSC